MPRRPGLDHATVVQAAAQLADEHGFEALTLATLAAHLGVRTPSLYNHIAGLPGLHYALALYGTQELRARLTRDVLGLAGAAAIRTFAITYRAFIKQRPGLYTATVRALNLPPTGDDQLEQERGELLAVIMAMFNAFQLSEAATIHAVRGLRSFIHGFASLEIAGGFGMPFDIDTSFNQLVDVFLSGLTQLQIISTPEQ